MARIKKGDTVVVIAGKDKGKQGTILAVKADRVQVEGVNVVIKHQKPNPNLGKEGGRITKEAFLHISNVALFNPITQKKDRVSYQFGENGKKYRAYRSSGEKITTND